MVDVSLEESARELQMLLDQLTGGPATQTARILDHGEPVLAVMPWELYEALLATAQIPTDPQTLLAATPQVRERILAAAAARAEALYRDDHDLTNFEAFGEGDLYDRAE